jgi:hypothetical protein
MSDSSPAPAHDDDNLWEVQDILAKRTSVRGHSEVLVVWKPSWIPSKNVMNGEVKRVWKQLPKCRFLSAVGDVILPVQEPSQLAKDLKLVEAESDARIASSVANQDLMRGTPRKSLGGVAKSVGPPHKTKK